MKRSVLLFFAHLDDETFGVSGNIGKYTQQGVPVDLMCASVMKEEIGTTANLPDS